MLGVGLVNVCRPRCHLTRIDVLTIFPIKYGRPRSHMSNLIPHHLEIFPTPFRHQPPHL
jgi:hypothetical protein